MTTIKADIASTKYTWAEGIPIRSLESIGLDEFQIYTRSTDRNPRPGVSGINLPMLGLYGEVGGLLSELKKKQRDSDSYLGYRESVIEEFGDTLWYLSNVADRLKLNLSTLARAALAEHENSNGAVGSIADFKDVQTQRAHKGLVSNDIFEMDVLGLASKTAALLRHVSTNSFVHDIDSAERSLVEIFGALVKAANDADISLQDAARSNALKTWSRWPSKKTYPPLFDDDLPIEERLPRELAVVIEEKIYGTRVFVMQHANGINIGDRLTDNISEPDDYRFHDVFHWTYMAVLGWSPVTRALLKLKRKSKPLLDENEDGARAQLIEEGVATWIFNHARRLNFYENVTTVDYPLLKSIKEFITGYEIQACPLWLWEQAILDGCRAFRFLRQHRRGKLSINLKARTVNIQRHP